MEVGRRCLVLLTMRNLFVGAGAWVECRLAAGRPEQTHARGDAVLVPPSRSERIGSGGRGMPAGVLPVAGARAALG